MTSFVTVGQVWPPVEQLPEDELRALLVETAVVDGQQAYRQLRGWA